jgi:hypothetical protein
MAYIPNYMEEDEQSGPSSIKTSSGGSRVGAVRSGATQQAGPSGGGSGPGFVNITRLLELNKGSGEQMAGRIAGDIDSQAKGAQGTFNDLKGKFDSQTKAALENSGANFIPTEQETRTGPDSMNDGWSEAKVQGAGQYANKPYSGPTDIRAVNPNAYDNATKQAYDAQQRVKNLQTSGGTSTELNRLYGANSSLYGSALDSYLTRGAGGSSLPPPATPRAPGNGGSQGHSGRGGPSTPPPAEAPSGPVSLNALQGMYSNIYGLMSQGNAAATTSANEAKTRAGSAQDQINPIAESAANQVGEKDRIKAAGGEDFNSFYTWGVGRQGNDVRRPIRYQDYVASRIDRGLPYLSEGEFLSIQATIPTPDTVNGRPRR